MRLKFDYQMNVYELYEYGDVHMMNCYCVSSFYFCHWFLQTSAIFCMRLKFDYLMAVYELYVYGDVHVYENCYCVSSFLSVSGFYLLSFFIFSFFFVFFLSFFLSFFLCFLQYYRQVQYLA